MGWGTFIAGRMLRTPKKRESSFEFFLEFYTGLFSSYVTSYKRRAIKKTVLVHPEIIDKVDTVEWEIELQKRAVNHGLSQQAVLVFVSIVWGILGVFHYGIAVLPLLWYFLKSKLINSSASEINSQFKEENFDVEQLLREIPALTRNQHEKELKEAELELLRRQEDSYKKKFGIR